MTFNQTLNQHFPGAMEESRFAIRSAEVLSELGFHRHNTIASVACCRDEISQTLQEETRNAWGLIFNKSSLAGMIFAGKTGFGAALAHAPQTEERERYVFYAMPHIAMGPNGEQGMVQRQGRDEPSSACGALLALLAEIKAGPIDTSFQPDDVEQSLLKARVATQLDEGESPDLLKLTRLAHDAIREDLERTIEQTVDVEKADYGVMTGIQIHGPEGKNYVQPQEAYVVVRGARRELDLGEKEAA